MARWAALAILLVGAQEKLPAVGTKRGQMYPDFVLPGVGGGMVRLSDYRGRKVLLIHHASW
jgi:hypothetical protein